MPRPDRWRGLGGGSVEIPATIETMETTTAKLNDSQLAIPSTADPRVDGAVLPVSGG